MSCLEKKRERKKKERKKNTKPKSRETKKYKVLTKTIYETLSQRNKETRSLKHPRRPRGR